MLVALSTLAAAQSHSTEATANTLTHFLNCCATHPDATLRYHASNMVLRIHSNTLYLSEPKARSRAGGHHHLGSNTDKPDTHNGAILDQTGVLRVVLSSAAKAETGGLFTNMKDGCIICTTLEKMGHPQPPTPIQVDNSTACGVANDNIKQQRSRAIACNSTGSATALTKTSSTYFGPPAPKIWPITSPSTTPPNTTNTCTLFISTPTIARPTTPTSICNQTVRKY